MGDLLEGDTVVALRNGTDYRDDIAQVGTSMGPTGYTYTRHDYKRGDEGLIFNVSITGSLDIAFNNGLTMTGCLLDNFARVSRHNTGVCSEEVKKWGERCN